MQKDSIIELLETKHKALFQWLENHDDDKWDKGPEGKWTTGQHILHLLQSIYKLNYALSFPKFILRYKFGVANRHVRDYDTVVNRYHDKLKKANGATFGPSRNMKVPKLNDKSYLIDRIKTENKKLQYKTRKWSDKQLDTLILPHPLIGKMPVREIIMWTAYHVEHHTKSLKEEY